MTKCLYFPTIGFPSDEWMKRALLYWDQVVRIVPPHYRHKDSALVQELASDTRELVSDYHDYHNESVIGDVQEAFTSLVMKHGDELGKRYGVPRLSGYTRTRVEKDTKGQYRLVPFAEDFGVYNAKLTNNLVHALKFACLAEEVDDGFYGPILRMHKRLAWVYMTALAERIAEVEADLSPVTAEPLAWTAVLDCTMERLAQLLLEVNLVGPAPTDQEMATRLVLIALEHAVPKDINRLSIDDILEVKRRNAATFESFQARIHQLAHNAATIVDSVDSGDRSADRSVLQERMIAVYEEQIADPLAKLEYAWQSASIETMKSIINVGAFVEIGKEATTNMIVDAVFGNKPVVSLAKAGATVMSRRLSEAHMDHKARRRARRESPISYLFGVREAMRPFSSLGSSHRTRLRS